MGEVEVDQTIHDAHVKIEFRNSLVSGGKGWISGFEPLKGAAYGFCLELPFSRG